MEKNVKDYVSIINEEFPMFTKKEINDIMITGFRRLHFFIKTGCDILMNNKIYTTLIYFGDLTNNSLKHYNYYKWKYNQRLRVLWRLCKLNKDWQQYYYFGMNEQQYKIYCSQINKRGRKRKIYTIPNIKFHKISDELIPDKAQKYFFRVKYSLDLGFTYFWKEYKGELEYVGKREDDKIKLVNKELWQQEIVKIRKPLTHLMVD